MKPLRIALVAAATLGPQALLFALQTYLLTQGRTDDVLTLASYAGLIALLFYIFDGHSGLVHSIGSSRFSPQAMAASFLRYRLSLLAVAAVAGLIALISNVSATFLACMSASLLLRLPWLDGHLDRRGLQPLALALGSAWMVILCVLVLALRQIDAEIAGMAALAGSIVLCGVRLLIRRPDELLPASAALMKSEHAAHGLIWHYMATFGLGQIYGRFVQFVIGATFAGPLPALVLYAKQLFNIGGLMVNFARRAEAARNKETAFHPGQIRQSLLTQALMLLPCAAVVFVMGLNLDLTFWAIAGVLIWQMLERCFTQSQYILQRLDRHREALGIMALLFVLGGAGLWFGSMSGMVGPFLMAEGLVAILSVCLLLRVITLPVALRMKP